MQKFKIQEHKNFQLVLLAIGILLLLIVGMKMYSNMVGAVQRDDVQSISDEVAEHSAKLLAEKISNDYKLLETVARALSLQGELDTAANRQFLQEQAQHAGSGKMIVSAPDGSSYSSDGQTGNLVELDGFKTALQGENYLSDRMTLPMTENQEGLLVSVPIYGQGKVIGVLSFGHDVEEYQQVLRQGAFERIGYACVVKTDGQMVLTPVSDNLKAMEEKYQPGVIERDLSLAELQFLPGEMAAGQSGLKRYTSEIDGEKRFLSYQPLEIKDWYLICMIPEDSVAFRNQMIGRIVLLVSSLLVLVFAMLISYPLLVHRRRKKALEEKLGKDTLTMLGSRKGMEQFFAALSIKGKGYAYVVVNMNRFKKLNDTLGFEAANLMLKNIADVLQNTVYGQEAAFRLESDHFAMICVFDNQASMSKRLDVLLDQLNSLTLDDGTIKYAYNGTFSCGVYEIDGTEEGIDEIENMALIALSMTKQLKVSSYTFFTEEMKKNLHYKNTLLSAVDQALDQREFVPYFQPQYSLIDGTITGAEILARWFHPTLGEIPPKDFLPLLELNGRILELDMYMLEEACKMIQKWLKEELMPVPIGVNMSRLNSYRRDYVERVLQTVKGYEISNSLIALEMSTSLIAGEEEIMMRIAQELHEQGFLLTADHFGVGQFSMALLYQFPLDIVKLSKRVIPIGQESTRVSSVLGAILKNAKEMGIEVAAEGVANQEQAEQLKKLGCTQAQGSLYSDPMPQAEFEQMIF